MPRIARELRGEFRRGTVAWVAVVALLGAGGCSSTVEVSYRPPPPPPPSPPPVVVTPTPAPTTAPTVVAACGPDQISVELGGVQADATSRAVPLLLRSRAIAPCAVANPVGITLLGPAGTKLTTRVQTTELPAGRTAVDSIPAASAAPSAADPAVPTPAPPTTAAPASASPADPAGTGVVLWLQWRSEPSVRTADAAADCVDAASFLLTLSSSAPPIPVAATLRACDGGTIYVSPAEANAG
jgi:hypothetical protein